jgi:hypothetical protein
MARYRDAIEWMVLNDDTEWLAEQDGMPSVTACLTADLFGKTTEQASINSASRAPTPSRWMVWLFRPRWERQS